MNSLDFAIRRFVDSPSTLSRMRISSVLIAGILGSYMANGLTSNQPKRVPSYVRTLGYVNTTIEDIEKFDRELCETNGGPDTHDAHKNNSKQFEVCVETVRDELHAEALAAQVRRSPFARDDVVYQGYCRRVPEFENCVKNRTESMKTCLDVEKHESADILYNIFSRVFRFLCEDGASRLTRISGFHDYSCIMSSAQAVMNCGNETIVEYVQATIANGAQLGGLGKLHLLVPDANKCSIFEKFQNCAVTVLKNCSDSTLSHLVDSVLDIVKETATCDQWLNPRASLTTVIIASLISVLIAISLLYFMVNYLRRKTIRSTNDIRLSEAYDDE